MKYLSLLPTLFLSVLVSAQATRSIDVSDFDQVKVGYGIDLEIVYGERHGLKLSGSRQLVDELVATVDDGTLSLGYGTKGWVGNKKLKGTLSAVVTTPRLRGVDANGAADARSKHVWEVGTFYVSASGAADVSLHIVAETVEAKASGSSDLRLRGSAQRFDVDASGASDVQARDLVAQRADIEASGAADVDVHAEEALDVSASGGSDVKYVGGATQVKVRSSGGADVERG